MPRAPAELTVISKTYELIVWGCHHIGKFPRSFRFTLGNRLELRLYDVLDQLLRAKYRSQERAALLQAINLELELLRFQFRLAKDLRCLPINSYGHAAKLVNEIGQMVGGWIKSTNRAGTVTPGTEGAGGP